MKTRVVIAEDNPFLAQSIKEKLELFPEEIKFKYIASNGRDLLDKLEEDSVVDVILMDLEMPEMDGIQATREVTNRYPQIKIVIQTVFDEDEKIYRAIKAGAMGYLLKDEPPQRLFEAIQAVMAGGALMSQSVMAKSLKLLQHPERIRYREARDFDLTRREREVLEQMSKGLNHKQIARNLFISPATVRKHMENIYKKLEVNNKIQAVQKALQYKLI